jgi:hypothetical protein
MLDAAARVRVATGVEVVHVTLESLVLGIFALLIGALWAFFGFRFFLILLPIWGFFIGFLAGAQVMAALFGDGFLATVTGWVVGFVFGLVFAVLSYLYYWIAVILLGASVGYAVGTGLMDALSLGDGVLAVVVGLVVAAGAAFVTMVLRAPKYLVIALSAFGGSAAIIAGVLVIIGTVTVGELEFGIVGAALREISSNIVWAIVWAVVGVAGLAYQVRSTLGLEELERTSYRYA